jgi:hypothetical protein
MGDSWMGPSYSYADELATPSELGIGPDGSASGIIKAVAGVNYYMDSIGFGESTMLAKAQGWDQRPLGIRYFTDTGMTCSNGEKMYEYVDTTPPGMPGRVGAEIKKTLGVDMKGLGPGILSDAVGALDPRPMLKAVTGSVYSACKRVTLPVGDLKGQLASPHPGGGTWINQNDTQPGPQGPSQTRWVYDRDVTQEEYDATEKTEEVKAAQRAAAEAAQATALAEGFRIQYKQAQKPKSAVAIGAILVLALGAFFFTRRP